MITLTINNAPRTCDDPQRNLLSFIRFDAGLTGTKYGCGEGLCGACTVLVDGQPLRSCTTTVGAVAGGHITTIEGLAADGALHPVQQAFIDESAMQCGYCIPAFIMTSVALLAPRARHRARGAGAEHVPLRHLPAHPARRRARGGRHRGRARCLTAPPASAGST